MKCCDISLVLHKLLRHKLHHIRIESSCGIHVHWSTHHTRKHNSRGWRDHHRVLEAHTHSSHRISHGIEHGINLHHWVDCWTGSYPLQTCQKISLHLLLLVCTWLKLLIQTLNTLSITIISISISISVIITTHNLLLLLINTNNILLRLLLIIHTTTTIH